MRVARDTLPKLYETPMALANGCPKGLGTRRCSTHPTPLSRGLHPPSLLHRRCQPAAALPLGAEAATAAAARIAVPAVSSTLLAPPLVDLHAQIAAAGAALDDHAVCTSCAVLGAIFSVLTVAATARFLLSFFPTLEASARQRRGPSILRPLVALDPFIFAPAQRRLFHKREEGDVNYAAMALLAAMSVALEVLFGDTGLLAQSVPDTELLYGLNYLIYCQHVLLLPQWAMAVFRYYSLI